MGVLVVSEHVCSPLAHKDGMAMSLSSRVFRYHYAGAPPEQRFIGKPVQKTGLVRVLTRGVSLAAYTGNILFATEYEFKCVAAGAGCDAPAEGSTVSGVFNKGKSTVVGTITGLEPETVYDCYVITNDKKCGKPFRVETEPVLYLGGSLWACDIDQQISQVGELGFKSATRIPECLEIPTTTHGADNVIPLSIVVRDEKVTFTYVNEIDTTYGIHTCTLTQSGTQIDDCVDVVDHGAEELSGLEILGTNAYIARPGEMDVLLCTIDKDGKFTDCDQTGPEEKAFTSLYASGDKMYLSGDGVTVCSIEANGKLSGCKVAYNNEMESTPSTAIQGSNAYITSIDTDTVLLCSVKSDGTFTSCEPTGLQDDFDSPKFIIIQGSTAFVTQQDDDDLIVCSILESGELATCEEINTPIDFGITAIAV